MGRIRKQKKGTPEVSTASLPDIIFMLLFFFMVVTVMRENTIMVKIKLPEATELAKIYPKDAVGYIYIGRPTEQYQDLYGTAPRIQLNDAFASVDDVPAFVKRVVTEVPEAKQKLITYSLRVDEEVTMGIVSDVKQKLRKADALKINYSSRPKAE